MGNNNYTEQDVMTVLAATAEFLVDIPASHDNGYQISYHEIVEWFTRGSGDSLWYSKIAEFLNAED